MKWSGCLLLLALAVPPAPAEAQQLIGQRVRGASRTCVYANPNLVMRRLQPQLERRVGTGEPCPRRYTRQDEAPERPPAIPSLATLVSGESENGFMVCTYEYRGRRYARRIAITQTCPYTPLFPY